MGSVLTKEQNSLIIGTLLGDGCLEKQSVNSRLKIDHFSVNKDYVFWKYKILENVAADKPRIVRQLNKRSGKICERWAFATRSEPVLNPYFDLFYGTGKKELNLGFIKLFKEPLSLAVWLMDDGYKRNDCNAIRFSTDCFTLNENQILLNCLKINFGVDSKIHRKAKVWNIYIPTREMDKVREIILPYISQVKSMIYKLPQPLTTYP